MSDRRHTLIWASTLATLLGQALPAQAGGRHGKLGHHTQVVGVGVAAPVMGTAPLGLGVMAAPATTTTLGLAPVAVPPQALGAGYTLVPAATPAAATAPSLGMAYTVVPATAAPATLGVAPHAYQMVGYGLAPAGSTAGGPTLGAGAGTAGATPDPEVLLGQALGGANLQKIKDHLGEVLQDQLAGGQHPRRRALVRLLTDSALEFARDELRVDLVNWLPIVRNLVSQVVDDQVDPAATAATAASDAAPTRPAVTPRPSGATATTPAVSPGPGGRRVIPIQASGYLVIDRIEVQGSIVATPSDAPAPDPEPQSPVQPVVKPTPAPTPTAPPAREPDTPTDPAPAVPTTPVTPTPSQPNLPPADQQPRDDGPLLPGEGNDG